MAISKKIRRHSGRVTPWMLNHPKELFTEYDISPQIFWDDWEDYRDGFRINKDRKMLRSKFALGPEIKKWNERLRLLIDRRWAKRRKVKEKLNLVV